MPKKGFVHIIPLLTIALLISSIGAVMSIRSENSQKQHMGKVLSQKEDQEDNDENSISSSDEEGKDQFGEVNNESISLDNSNTGSSSNKTKTVSKTKNSETEIVTENGKTKIKVKNAEGEFETETEENMEKIKARIGGLRIEFERDGDKFIAKVKDENGEEVEINDKEKEDLFDELEDKLEDDDIEIATGSAELGFVQNGNKVRTNFPLSVNPTTGELFVTTPNGTKVVTILPDVAIQNMIRAGILTRIEEPPVPPSTPPEGTSSSQEATVLPSVEGAAVELTEVNEEPVYIIRGVKEQQFLGILPVEIKMKTTVSATDGRLVDITQGFLSRILDLLSF